MVSNTMPSSAAKDRLARLVRFEFFKLRRRPMPLILLAVQLAATFCLPLVIYSVIRFGGSDQASTLDDQGSHETLARIVFPGIMAAAPTNALGFGLPLVIILTAATFGGESAWGTVRLLLARGVGRSQCVLAKLVAIAAWWPLALAVGTAAGLILAWLLAAVDGQPGPSAGSGDVGLLLRSGAAWIAAMTYVGLTAVVTMQFRSTAVGVAAGLMTFYGKQLVGGVIASLGVPIFDWLVRLGVAHNVDTLMGGEDAENSPALAIAILLFYLVTACQGAARHLRRHDVVVAGVG